MAPITCNTPNNENTAGPSEYVDLCHHVTPSIQAHIHRLAIRTGRSVNSDIRVYFPECN